MHFIPKLPVSANEEVIIAQAPTGSHRDYIAIVNNKLSIWFLLDFLIRFFGSLFIKLNWNYY